jgi:hypothetical protein
MTETEWVNGADPDPMLDFLRGKATDRQLWLFGVACLRRLSGLFPNAVLRQVVEFGERDADGLASHADLRLAQGSLDSWCGSGRTRHGAGEDTRAEGSAIRAAACLLDARPTQGHSRARETARYAAAAVHRAANDRRAIRNAPGDRVVEVARAVWQAAQAALAAERQNQAALLREIVGNPFRPPAVERAWRTPEVMYLAGQIYEQRAFEWMPELADTLEEAGCKDAAILGHLRSPGPHLLGCWALDLLTAKE